MKLKHTSCLLLLLVALLTSCGNDRGKPLSDFDDATTGDSLLYYYAQLKAYEYWKEARNDTSLRSQKERDLYFEGFKKGFDALRQSTKEGTYNLGVRHGARTARRILEFEEQYGVEFDEDVILQSLAYGLANGQDIPQLKYQDEFFRLLGQIKQNHTRQKMQDSKITLIEEARKRNLSKISDHLYYRVIKKGHGPFPKNGDAVFLSVDYERTDGTNLGMPSTERIIVGSDGVPEVMDQAYSHLNKGTVAVFATTADEVFGSRAEIMGLDPEDVLIITITLNDITPLPGDDSETDNQNLPQ